MSIRENEKNTDFLMKKVDFGKWNIRTYNDYIFCIPQYVRQICKKNSDDSMTCNRDMKEEKTDIFVLCKTKNDQN